MVSGRWVPIAGASLPRLLNHPGHADQKSHGRKGGVRDSLAKAHTVAEISEVVASEASALTGHPVRVNLQGLDPQIAREYGEGLLAAVERFPNSRLGKVGTYGPGGSDPEARGDPGALANTDHGPVTRNLDKIMFNAAAGAQEGRLREALQRSEARGETVGHDPAYVAIHEYGHVVAGAGYAEARVMQAAVDTAANAGMSVKEYVRQQVSAYATSDHVELSAEVFADFVIRGSDASSFSKNAMREIETEFAARGAAREV